VARSGMRAGNPGIRTCRRIMIVMPSSHYVYASNVVGAANPGAAGRRNRLLRSLFRERGE
jgi:hypothetical protein